MFRALRYSRLILLYLRHDCAAITSEFKSNEVGNFKRYVRIDTRCKKSKNDDLRITTMAKWRD